MNIPAAADDAIFVGFGRVAFLDGDDVVVGFGVEIDHRLQAALVRLHDHVGQEQRERLVADQVARAPDGVAEAERNLLAREAGLAGARLQTLEMRELVILAALRQRVVELELQVEMILDDTLVAAGHEDEVLDPGFARLVHDILDHRLVDDGEHFLGDGLGSRKKTRAEAGDGEDCLANFFHPAIIPSEGRAAITKNDMLMPELNISEKNRISVWGVNHSNRFLFSSSYGKPIDNRLRR
jgi:hypothetical protein